jgi:hypothetical protein
LPGNVTSIIFATTLVLLMAREECSHALDCGKTNSPSACQVSGPSHSAANALLARFLRRQAAFAMLLAQF